MLKYNCNKTKSSSDSLVKQCNYDNANFDSDSAMTVSMLWKCKQWQWVFNAIPNACPEAWLLTVLWHYYESSMIVIWKCCGQVFAWKCTKPSLCDAIAEFYDIPALSILRPHCNIAMAMTVLWQCCKSQIGQFYGGEMTCSSVLVQSLVLQICYCRC